MPIVIEFIFLDSKFLQKWRLASWNLKSNLWRDKDMKIYHAVESDLVFSSGCAPLNTSLFIQYYTLDPMNNSL